MSLPKVSPAEIVSGGAKLVQSGLSEGSKLAVAYGKPLLNKSADFGAQAAEWSLKNPALATCAVVAGSSVVIIAAPGLVATPALSALGFTAGGVQAGSIAAGVHGTIGNVAAGSAFAIGQSAGAGGAGLAVVHGVTQAGAAAVSIGSATLAWVKAKL